MEYVKSQYIYLENIKSIIKKLEDGYEINFKNGRKDFIKSKIYLYFDFPFEEI